MSISKIIDNPITNLSINTALVYGVAYLGRAYFLINPVQAALFSLGTHVAAHLGKQLAQRINDPSKNETFAGHTVHFICLYTPTALAVAYKVFSPLQAITAIGLTLFCSDFYTLCSSFFSPKVSTPWSLRSA